MLKHNVLHLLAKSSCDLVQSKCVLTACYSSHSGIKSGPALSKGTEQLFLCISPLHTNGACCAASSRGSQHASHHYAIENTDNDHCLHWAYMQSLIFIDQKSTIFLPCIKQCQQIVIKFVLLSHNPQTLSNASNFKEPENVPKYKKMFHSEKRF